MLDHFSCYVCCANADFQVYRKGLSGLYLESMCSNIECCAFYTPRKKKQIYPFPYNLYAKQRAGNHNTTIFGVRF